jgi:hypothetical protein
VCCKSVALGRQLDVGDVAEGFGGVRADADFVRVGGAGGEEVFVVLGVELVVD